jgi:hypothetical protein
MLRLDSLQSFEQRVTNIFSKCMVQTFFFDGTKNSNHISDQTTTLPKYQHENYYRLETLLHGKVNLKISKMEG